MYKRQVEKQTNYLFFYDSDEINKQQRITINQTNSSLKDVLDAVHSIREKGNWDLLRDVFRMRPTQHPNSLVTGEEIWKYSGNNLFNPLVTSSERNMLINSDIYYLSLIHI